MYSKIRDTCIATLNDALHMRGNLFDECRKEACTIIESNLQALAENNDTGIFGDQLRKIYPWFHFVVLPLICKASFNVAIHVSLIFEYVVLYFTVSAITMVTQPST
jgi:hypothetical protein